MVAMAVEAAPESGRSTPGGPDAAGSDELLERELPEAPTTAYVPAPDEAPSLVGGDSVGGAGDDQFADVLERPLDDGGEQAAPHTRTFDAQSGFSDTHANEARSLEGDESSRPGTTRRSGSSRRFLALSVTFAVALVALSYTGYRSSLRMTGGASISPQQRSPSQPGYEAAVRPTPVTFLAITTDGGELRSLSVVTQGTGETGGTIVTIPSSLFLKSEDGKVRIPNYIEAEDGMDELQTELEASLGFGMTDQLVVTESDVDSLLGGKPLAVRNPEQLLVDFQGVLVPQFESGDVSLDPGGLMAYLNYLGPEESEYNRLNRQQLVLERLLALGADGFKPTAPDDNVTALAELFTALGSGEASVIQLPVKEARIGGRPDGGTGQGASFTAPDNEAIDATLGSIVPFPISGFPGQRLGVKLLNGTNQPQLELKLASDVVNAGAEVKVVGNAKVLPQATSSVAISLDASPEEREQAQRLADALKAKLTDQEKLGEDVRAVVVLGQDQL